jgi:AcrR family transcriptional regulator
MTPATRPRRRSPRERSQEIVDATRGLFDEQGVQEASIDRIAKAVGINKALIYRHFASKDELFVLTVTHYLDELAERMRDQIPADGDPAEQLERAVDVFTAFCLEFPAFLDCSLSLMRRPIGDLQDVVSDAVMIRLGQAMVGCLGISADILRRGDAAGVFEVDDPDFAANHLYTQTLGTMHLARIGVGVREGAPGIPQMFALDPEQVRRAAMDDALRAVSGPRPARPVAR